MKSIILNEIEYKVEKYNGDFDDEQLKEKYTDYFEVFDYVFGDYAYGKLRLKGFYEENNPKCNKINNIKTLDSYIKNYCSYGAKYFLLKKTEKKC